MAAKRLRLTVEEADCSRAGEIGIEGKVVRPASAGPEGGSSRALPGRFAPSAIGDFPPEAVSVTRAGTRLRLGFSVLLTSMT